MSYPVGRDFIERELNESGAVLGSLSLFVPANGWYDSPEGQGIVEVFWFSAPADSLYMRIWAVQSARRREIAGLLTNALPTAGRWAAAALTWGYGWSATGHRLILRFTSSALKVEKR